MKYNYRHFSIFIILLINSTSVLYADTRANIEIVGIKLIDKDQISVETEISNLSTEAITIDPRIWVRTAALNGQYLGKAPIMIPGMFRAVLSIYADLITEYPNPKAGQPISSFTVMDWVDDPEDPGRYPPPPIILKPGEATKMFVKIPITKMLAKDFMKTLSKDVWMRVGLDQLGINGKQYAPDEIIHGNLYKLEKPVEGEHTIGFTPIQAPF